MEDFWNTLHGNEDFICYYKEKKKAQDSVSGVN